MHYISSHFSILQLEALPSPSFTNLHDIPQDIKIILPQAAQAQGFSGPTEFELEICNLRH
jgi:hypothetical protein